MRSINYFLSTVLVDCVFEVRGFERLTKKSGKRLITFYWLLYTVTVHGGFSEASVARSAEPVVFWWEKLSFTSQRHTAFRQRHNKIDGIPRHVRVVEHLLWVREITVRLPCIEFDRGISRYRKQSCGRITTLRDPSGVVTFRMW